MSKIIDNEMIQELWLFNVSRAQNDTTFTFLPPKYMSDDI